MLLAWEAGSAAVEFVNRICVLALRLSPRDICLFVRWEKGYSDYRYDHVAFLGFRYYHSIEYTKLDWLKASGYRNFKIQTSGLPRINFLVCKETRAVFTVSQRSMKVRA